MLKKMCAPAAVHEHVGDHLPPGACLQDVGGEEHEVMQQSPPVHEPEEEDEDVHHDEDDRRVVVAVAQRAAQKACHDIKVRRRQVGASRRAAGPPCGPGLCYRSAHDEGEARLLLAQIQGGRIPRAVRVQAAGDPGETRAAPAGEPGPRPRRVTGELEPLHPGPAGGRGTRDRRRPEPPGREAPRAEELPLPPRRLHHGGARARRSRRQGPSTWSSPTPPPPPPGTGRWTRRAPRRSPARSLPSARQCLAPGGNCVLKIFQGGEEKEILDRMRGALPPRARSSRRRAGRIQWKPISSGSGSQDNPGPAELRELLLVHLDSPCRCLARSAPSRRGRTRSSAS